MEAVVAAVNDVSASHGICDAVDNQTADLPDCQIIRNSLFIGAESAATVCHELQGYCDQAGRNDINVHMVNQTAAGLPDCYQIFYNGLYTGDSSTEESDGELPELVDSDDSSDEESNDTAECDNIDVCEIISKLMVSTRLQNDQDNTGDVTGLAEDDSYAKDDVVPELVDNDDSSDEDSNDVSECNGIDITSTDQY